MLALAMIVIPLIEKPTQLDDDHRQRNIDIARQRLAELKQQLLDGALTQTEFDAYYLELQLTLDDDMQTVDRPKSITRQGRWIIPVLLVVIPTLSLFLYLLLGDTNALRKAELQQTNQQTAANIENMVQGLQQRLQQNPNDLEGWSMLGRSYTYLEQYQNAADVYAELNRRKPDDAEIMVQYANNLAMARNGQMAGEPMQLIDKALELSPDNANALWLAGMSKAEQGDYSKAAEYWRKLLSLLPPDSETAPQVQQMLAAVEQQQNKPAANAVSIEVQVNIDPALKTKLPADKIVFIYAQAVNGPKMPLAIVRKQLADLPVTVTLNDSMAMQGSSHLSEHQQLRIIARVSKSGQAMTEPGDLIGNTEIQQPFGVQPVIVLINQEAK